MIDQKKYIRLIETYSKAYPDLQKKNTELCFKAKKDQEQYQKTITELKVKARTFNKSSITFWSKAVWQSKTKQMSAAVTQLMDITKLDIVSVLLCLNCFYYQANLKLINCLKFA